MAAISYVNGRYVSHKEAVVHIEDRGYQFSDGVYEVIEMKSGNLVDGDWHFERLARSLKELAIKAPMSDRALRIVMKEVALRNNIKDGNIYLQISRGVATRDHHYREGLKASLILTISKPKTPSTNIYEKGAVAVTHEDQRWKRRDIKSISLLPNVLAKQYAVKKKAIEALLIDEHGYVTEGSASNIYIIDEKEVIYTYPKGSTILGGITRERVLTMAKDCAINVQEEPFTLEQLYNAKEAFITSTIKHVMPIVKVDDKVIGDGKVGKVTKTLMDEYEAFASRE